jgi:hypothetical protein
VIAPFPANDRNSGELRAGPPAFGRKVIDGSSSTESATSADRC